RNRLAVLHQRGRVPTPEAEADARRALTVAVLERAITERLATGPKLRPDQVRHLSALLNGGADRG
ncbi:hypothetical protein, partial [Ruania rhizosphaerae]|uniref:hypothetical protein n=1 Tax=Ruania rhizosphaerae TaxID=1840413 RepID=UPI00135B23F4